MEGTTLLILVNSIGYESMVSFSPTKLNKMVYEHNTYTTMFCLMVKIYSSFQAMTFISCTCIPRMGISVAKHTSFRFIDKVRVFFRNLGNAACHLVSRDRLKLKSNCSMLYIIVVYFSQSGGIGESYGANVVCIHKQSVCVN